MSNLVRIISCVNSLTRNVNKYQKLTNRLACNNFIRPCSNKGSTDTPENVGTSETKDLSFPALLHNSVFMQMGPHEDKIVKGKIFHVVENDLYVDFGWKFHCVVNRPNKNGDLYVKGAEVKLLVKSLELSSRFLGSTKDLTILEADCQLVGLISSPVRQSQSGRRGRRMDASKIIEKDPEPSIEKVESQSGSEQVVNKQ